MPSTSASAFPQQAPLQPNPIEDKLDYRTLMLFPEIPSGYDNKVPNCFRIRFGYKGEALGFYTKAFFFSNFNQLVPFTIEGQPFRSVEEYYCSRKALTTNRLELADDIIKGKLSPVECKLEASFKSYAATPDQQRKWNAIKDDIMMVALRAKYAFGNAKRALLETGSAILLEMSPDKEWGIGCNPNTIWETYDAEWSWNGANKLGRMLMIVRG
jgi:ribA/ribD-fused uncharacterized protein